jgi:tetratricopeptide (TPR) repeat protein
VSKTHLTERCLIALVEADTKAVALAAAHLALCRGCRDLLSGLSPEVGSVVRQRLSTPDPTRRFVADYKAVFARVVDRCRIEEARFEQDQDDAGLLFAELEAFPAAKRRLIVANVGRFQSRALAELLLERSRSAWTNDPAIAEIRAVLACDIAALLHAEGYQELLLNDLRAEAWSYVANCCRIRGHLDDSSAAFKVAESFLEEGSGEDLDRVQLLDLKVSLLRDQGDHDAALAKLDEVIRCRRSLGDHHLVGRGLVSRALIEEDSGRLEQAVMLLEESAGLLDVQREPLLELTRCVNLMNCLILLGRTSDARELLGPAKMLVRKHGNRLNRLRLLWVEGRLLYAVGHKALGKELLASVHEGYLQEGLAFEAASVALDLATICLDLGQAAEVEALAERVKSYALMASSEAERKSLAVGIGLGPVEASVVACSFIAGVVARLRASSLQPGCNYDS